MGRAPILRMMTAWLLEAAVRPREVRPNAEVRVAVGMTSKVVVVPSMEALIK